MKLTKRICVVLVAMAVLVSGFVLSGSAEFTEDNIEDILEYYMYPQYLSEDYQSYAVGASYTLSDGISAFMSDKGIIAADPSNSSNKVLSSGTHALSNEEGYFGYELSFSQEMISELALTMRIRSDKGIAKTLPKFAVSVSSYDENNAPVGENGMITPITVDFETGVVQYAKVSASDATAFNYFPVAGLSVNSGMWYTVTLVVDCNKGTYRFSIISDNGDSYESSAISLGEAELVGELSARYFSLPANAGSNNYIDNVEINRGTILRGDTTREEATAEALYNLAELAANEDIDLETELRIAAVYEVILESDYEPVYTKFFDEETVKKLYEGARDYVPQVKLRAYLNAVDEIDTTRSFRRRSNKIDEIAAIIENIESKHFAVEANSLYFIEQVKLAAAEYIDSMNSKIAEEVAELREDAAKEGISAEQLAAINAEIDKYNALPAEISKILNAYYAELADASKADTRLVKLEDDLEALLENYGSVRKIARSAVKAITECDELVVLVDTARANYKSEILELRKIKVDSEAFVDVMSSYDPDSMVYSYITSTYEELLSYLYVDTSYDYPTVYNYSDEFNSLVEKAEQIIANKDRFMNAVSAMTAANAGFSVQYENYLIASEFFNGTEIVIHSDVDANTINGFLVAKDKYFAKAEELKVTIDACESFIIAAGRANAATLYGTVIKELAAAKACVAEGTNVVDDYPGVKEAKETVAAVEVKLKNMEDGAKAYVSAVAAIEAKTSFAEKKAAVAAAYGLKASGNVVGYPGVSEANIALDKYSESIDVLEGNSKTLVESVAKLADNSLTLAERRELIIIAQNASKGAEPTYSGVSAAKERLAVYVQDYKANVAEINAEFNKQIVNSSSVAGAAVNQPKFYGVVEIIVKLAPVAALEA